MALSLRIFLLTGTLIFLGIIIYFLTKKRLNLKYTLLWLLSALVMIIVTIFPQIVRVIANIIGIKSEVNVVFVFAVSLVLFIILSLTIIVSLINNKIYRLTQTQAILEKRVRELEQKLGENISK